MEKPIELLQFIINRYDFYYESINSKSNAYLTLNTFILGGIISGFYIINEKMDLDWYFKYLFYLTLAINFLSLFFTVLAVQPFLYKKKAMHGSSLFYYGDVAHHNVMIYKTQLENATKESIQDDALIQIHSLAIGLNKKFNKLNWSTKFITIQGLLIALFSILLSTK